MNKFSSFKYRRLRQQPSAKIKHLLAFNLLNNSWGIFIENVLKVVTLESIYGQTPENGLGLTCYQNQEIVVIDLAYLLGLETLTNRLNYAYMMIVQLANDLVGLPLVNPPVIHRVPDNSLISLPPSYLGKNRLSCLSSQIVKIPDSTPIFILDPNKLIEQAF